MSIGQDPHSFSNFKHVCVTHIHLDLYCDFKRKAFIGHADITAKVLVDGTSELILDAKHLAIDRVQDRDTDQYLLHTLPQHHKSLGMALSIPIPEAKRQQGSQLVVRVYYSTTIESGGIQWMEPSQTDGKQFPFVYTQCEAILARTLLPCQDTPAVKAPYSIKVSLPPPLVAACSGTPVHDHPVLEDDGSVSYSYRQVNPIPAYLIAIVAGKLEKAKVGPRSSVWCEQVLLDRAVHEFKEHTEMFIQAGEAITGIPYEWGVYDMVVLPSAFPYGGMENPNLTFLSSSLLAGDRSLTNVVAHEITHSWAGNYTTNSSWRDFWLNEGFTVYIERMILGRVNGGKPYRDFEVTVGYNVLQKTVADMSEHPEFTKLNPDLAGIDPDEAFSRIPYEKGSLFLFYLEQKVGGEQAMQKWLKGYFKEFRTKSLDTEQMKAHFLAHFKAEGVAQSVLDSIEWNTWLHTAGLPAFDPTPFLDQSLVTAVDALSAKWRDQKGAEAQPSDLQAFKARQTMLFLDTLLNTACPMDIAVLQKLNNTYRLSESPNVEILHRWIMLCLKSEFRDIFSTAADFLSKHGRGLYVKPMYTTLAKVDHEFASTVYKKNRPFYHSVIRNAFDAKLNA